MRELMQMRKNSVLVVVAILATLHLNGFRFFDLHQFSWAVFALVVVLQAYTLSPLLIQIVTLRANPVLMRDRPVVGGLPGEGISASLDAPFWEEVLFRGPLLLVWNSLPIFIVPATAISSFLFGLLHNRQFPLRGMETEILWKILIGWLYAWSAITSGGLILPVLLHFIHNGTVDALGMWHNRIILNWRENHVWRS